jgi:hypothetical protein
MKLVAAPVRQPFMRGKIERFFRSAKTGYLSDEELDLGQPEAFVGNPSALQVQEIDDYVCDLLRILYEMDNSAGGRDPGHLRDSITSIAKENDDV